MNIILRHWTEEVLKQMQKYYVDVKIYKTYYLERNVELCRGAEFDSFRHLYSVMKSRKLTEPVKADVTLLVAAAAFELLFNYYLIRLQGKFCTHPCNVYCEQF